jgi:hypothetical protein
MVKRIKIKTAAAVIAAALTGLLLCQPQADAQTTVTLTPTQWNTIFNSSPSNADGAGYHLFAGGGREGLVDYDLSQIPANAVIDSVSMSMYMDRSTAAGGQSIFMYRLTSSWGMGNSGAGQSDQGVNGGGGTLFGASQNDATWNDRFYNASTPSASIAWKTAGGDYSASLSASALVGTGIASTGTPGPGGPLVTTWSGPGLVSDVQSWLTGLDANDGWILTDYASAVNDPPSGSALGTDGPRRFISPSNNLSNDLPYLTIAYTTVPEPASIALLGLGSMAMLSRRWRHA